MIKYAFNFLMIVGIVLGTIFMIFTSASPRGRDKVVIYLNLFMLFLTLNNLQITLVDNDIVLVNFFVRKLLIPWYALIMPMLYTFLAHYLRVEKKIFSLLGFSVCLFVLEIAVRMVFVVLYYPDKNNYVVAKYAQIEEIVNAVFTLAIFIKSFILVFKYAKLFEYVLTFDNIKWIKNLLFLGSISLLFWVCAIIMNLDKVINPIIFIYYPLRLSSTCLVYWLGYQGFYNYEMMTERIALRKVILAKKEIFPTIHLNKVYQGNRIFEQINQYILDSESYLDPNCSIETIAIGIKMKPKNVSDSIKNSTKGNFSDYINQLRVAKAKKHLVDLEYKFYTIDAIGLECGFNSKTTFYNAFKKFTKQTPAQFKQENS
jgi:AraC-like DNA-binding protein